MSGNHIRRTSQAIDNLSFDETYEQAAVELLTENAGGTALERQKKIATEAKQISQMMTRIATKSTDSNITYTGMAPINSLTSDAVWKITRYDESVSEISKFAGNGQFNQIWDNRESLSYA